jgi:SAM-dependent methyltransferase
MKWLRIIAVLIIIMICVKYYNSLDITPYHEGFTQLTPFTLKTGPQIYDSFYSELYDDVFNPTERLDENVQKIIEMTHPSAENSVFLDVGSGTGHLVELLTQAGYNAHGIDKSQAMVDIHKRNYPNNNVRCGDIADPIVFDRGALTHITCMNMTYYQLVDRRAFFNNCRYWLRPGGYLMVHLVDRDKYNPLPAAANPLSSGDNPQKYLEKRITKAKVDFNDFVYASSYEQMDDGQTVVVRETMTDSLTQNVRQNEFSMDMERMDETVRLAINCGFTAHGQIRVRDDDFQYIYIFL